MTEIVRLLWTWQPNMDTRISSSFWKQRKGDGIHSFQYSLIFGKKHLHSLSNSDYPQVYYLNRTLVFGQSGRTKGPLLFFLGSVLLWAYPMYFLRVSDIDSILSLESTKFDCLILLCFPFESFFTMPEYF